RLLPAPPVLAALSGRAAARRGPGVVPAAPRGGPRPDHPGGPARADGRHVRGRRARAGDLSPDARRDDAGVPDPAADRPAADHPDEAGGVPVRAHDGRSAGARGPTRPPGGRQHAQSDRHRPGVRGPATGLPGRRTFVSRTTLRNVIKVFQLSRPAVILRTKTGTEQAWGAVSRRSLRPKRRLPRARTASREDSLA